MDDTSDFRDIHAPELNTICDLVEEDMDKIWRNITDAVIEGHAREITVWNLHHREIAIRRMRRLDYKCHFAHDGGIDSCFSNGLTISWKVGDSDEEKESNDV